VGGETRNGETEKRRKFRVSPFLRQFFGSLIRNGETEKWRNGEFIEIQEFGVIISLLKANTQESAF